MGDEGEKNPLALAAQKRIESLIDREYLERDTYEHELPI